MSRIMDTMGKIASRGAVQSGIIFAALLMIAACQPAPVVPTNTPAPSPIPPTATPIPPTPTIAVPFSDIAAPVGEASKLYVVNAAIGPSNIDIYAETSLTISNLPLGRLSPPLGIGEGTFNIRALPARAAATDQAFAESPVPFTAGESTILTIAGDLTKSPPQITTRLIKPDLSPVESNSGRVAAVYLGETDTDAPVDTRIVLRLDDQDVTEDAKPYTVGYKTFRVFRGGRIVAEQSTYVDTNSSTIFFVIPDAGAPGGFQIETFTAATARQLRVRFAHAAARLGAVNVQIDEAQVGQGVPFRAVSDYTILTPRTYRLRITAASNTATADATADSPTPDATTDPTSASTQESNPASGPTEAVPNNLLIDQTITLEADQFTTILLTARTQEVTINGELQNEYLPTIRLYNEDQTALESDQARLSILNTVENTVIDVSNYDRPYEDFTQIPFDAISFPVPIQSGNYALTFIDTAAGSPRVVEKTNPFQLTAGTSYLYIVTGGANTNGQTSTLVDPLLLSTDSSGGIALDTVNIDDRTIPPDQMRIRVINAVKDTGSFDLTVGNKTFQDVQRRESVLAELVGTPLSQYTVSLPGQESPILTRDIRFEGGTQATIFVVGTVNSPDEPLQAFVSPDRRDLPTTSALVRVTHAASAYGSAVITVTSGTTTSELVPFFSFPAITDPLNVPIGTVTFQVSDRAIADPEEALLAELTDIELQAGVRYDLLFVSENGLPKLVLVSSSF